MSSATRKMVPGPEPQEVRIRVLWFQGPAQGCPLLQGGWYQNKVTLTEHLQKSITCQEIQVSSFDMSPWSRCIFPHSYEKCAAAGTEPVTMSKSQQISAHGSCRMSA